MALGGRAKQLTVYHLGKADDCIERRAKLVRHLADCVRRRRFLLLLPALRKDGRRGGRGRRHLLRSNSHILLNAARRAPEPAEPPAARIEERDSRDHPDAARLSAARQAQARSEEHTSELQSLMRLSYAVFCLKQNTRQQRTKSI